MNQRNPAYRIDIQIQRVKGFDALRTGANGIGATAIAGIGRMPASPANEQVVWFSGGHIYNVMLESTSAADAPQPNTALLTLISPQRPLCGLMSDFGDAGKASSVRNDNFEPVEQK